MSQDGFEDTDTQDLGGQDSILIRDLRKQLKEQSKVIKRYESLEEDLNRVRSETAERLLVDAGYPKMLGDVLEKVEGIPTSEDVNAFLEARGLQAKDPGTDTTPDDGGGGTEEPAGDSVQQVAGLGQQVASAAQRTISNDIVERINQATSQEELNKVMVEAGLSG